MNTTARMKICHAIDVIDAVRDSARFLGIGRVKAELTDMLTAIDEQAVSALPLRRSMIGRLVTDAWPLAEDTTIAVIEAEKAYLQIS